MKFLLTLLLVNFAYCYTININIYCVIFIIIKNKNKCNNHFTFGWVVCILYTLFYYGMVIIRKINHTLLIFYNKSRQYNNSQKFFLCFQFINSMFNYTYSF